MGIYMPIVGSIKTNTYHQAIYKISHHRPRLVPCSRFHLIHRISYSPNPLPPSIFSTTVFMHQDNQKARVRFLVEEGTGG